MKTSSTVLAVLALLGLIPCSQALAQTGQAPQTAVAAPTAAAPATAAFLASLAAGTATAPDNLRPVPDGAALLLSLRGRRVPERVHDPLAQGRVPALPLRRLRDGRARGPKLR